MLTITAGESCIMVAEMYSETRTVKGVPVPTFKLMLESGASKEDIENLITQPWNVLDVNGEKSVIQGYTTIHEHYLVLAKIPNLLFELEALRAENEALKAAMPKEESLITKQ